MNKISNVLRKSVVTLTLICILTGLLSGVGSANKAYAEESSENPVWVETEENTVTVRWFPMDDAADYRVFRRTIDSNTWVTLATVDNNTFEYVNKDVADGTYVYAVCKRTLTASGSKTYGTRIQAKPVEIKKIETPVFDEDPYVYAEVEETNVTVYWTMVDDAADYRVFRKKENSNSWTTLATVNKNTDEYVDKNVPEGEYIYAVCKRFYNDNGSKTYGTRITTDVMKVEANHRVLASSRSVYAVVPSATPTATNTPVPTATNTPVPTATNTPMPTATNTPVPTATNTPIPTATNTPVPTATNTPVPTATNTPKPTATNTPVPTATNTPVPTATNTPVPTATNTPVPTATNTPKPTATLAAEFKAASVREALVYSFAHGGEFVDVSKLDTSLNEISATFTELIHGSGEVLVEWAAYNCATYKVEKSGKKITAVGVKGLDDKFYDRYPLVQAAIAKAMKCISPEMSDFEKALALQNYIVDTTVYTSTGLDNAGAAYNVLIYGKGICGGYADAYRVLLHEAGIETRRVSTTTHAWTAAKLDGEWYMFDATWDDVTKNTDRGYQYFARTGKEYETGLTKKHGSYRFTGEAVECVDNRYADWFGHNVVGKMYYCKGSWYYAEGNKLVMSDIDGNNRVVVLTENSTIVMKGSTETTVSYQVSGKTITINR